MKINSDNNLQPNAPVRKETSVAGEGDSAFSKVLEKTVGSAPTESVRQSVSIQPVIKPLMETPVEQLYANTDRMINALEQYQQLLGNSRVSLREVEPAMQQLKTEVKTLEPLAEGLPKTHPMKPIMSETLLTAAKEIARFEGGAYVPE